MEWKHPLDIYMNQRGMIQSDSEIVSVPREVPELLREHESVRIVQEHMSLGLYGFGADIIADGFQRLERAKIPNCEEIPGVVEAYCTALRMTSAEEYSQTLGFVRTRGQEQILEALMERALRQVPGFVVGERNIQELDEMLKGIWGI